MRFGNYLAEQFAQPEFDMKSLRTTASSLASLIFVLPTQNEFLEAYQAISGVLHLNNDATHMAEMLASAADVAHKLGIHNSVLEVFQTAAHGAADTVHGVSEAARLAGIGADGTISALGMLAAPAEATGQATEIAGVVLGFQGVGDLLARLGLVREGLQQVTDPAALLREAVVLARKYGPTDAERAARALQDQSSQGESPALAI